MNGNSESSLSRTSIRWIVGGSLFVFASVALVLGGIGSLKYTQIQASMSAPAPPEMPVTVTLATAEPASFRRESVVVGNVLAPQSIQLRTELTGVVTEVAFEPGGIVRKEDLLIKFDTRSEQAALKSAEATRGLAEAAYQRAQRLSDANANSVSELDIAKAELAKAEAEAERLQVLIDKKTLRAPFDARAGIFDLHVGQYLDSGTDITRLEGLASHLLVDFAMPAHVADAVVVGDLVTIQSSTSDLRWTAPIVAIDPLSDPITRSVVGRATLNDRPKLLQPRDSVRVTVPFGDPITAVAIPAVAIRRNPMGNTVYVAVKQDGQLRAQSRPVVLAGDGDGRLTYVIEGLQAGDDVVAHGAFKVLDGSLLASVPSAESRETFTPVAVKPEQSEFPHADVNAGEIGTNLGLSSRELQP